MHPQASEARGRKLLELQAARTSGGSHLARLHPECRGEADASPGTPLGCFPQTVMRVSKAGPRPPSDRLAWALSRGSPGQQHSSTGARVGHAQAWAHGPTAAEALEVGPRHQEALPVMLTRAVL